MKPCKTKLVPCCPNCGHSAGGLTRRRTKPLPYRCPFCAHEFAQPATRQMLDLMCETCRTAELARFPEGPRLGARLARRRTINRQIRRETYEELKREGW